MHRRTGAALLAAPVGSRSGGKRIATSATAGHAIAGHGYCAPGRPVDSPVSDPLGLMLRRSSMK